MPKKRLKTYLSIPVFLGMLVLAGQVSADDLETELLVEPAVVSENLTVSPESAIESMQNQPSSVGLRSVAEDAPVEPVSVQLDPKGITIHYNQDRPSHSQVLYSVWSDRQGQDDVYWYQADQEGEARITFDNHKDYGIYHLHTYTNTAGRLERVSAQTFEREEPNASPLSGVSVTEPGRATVSLTDYREAKTNFTVTVRDEAPKEKSLTDVRVAVWSKDKGQDDIRWYEPSVSQGKASVNVNIADHSNTSDHYLIHVFTTYADGQVIGTVLGEFKITKPAPTEPAKVELFDYHENKNDFTVRVFSGENTKEIADVRVAVWSHDKGQDDIRWYEPAISNNQASVTINSSNHSRKTDTYTVHVYTTYKDGTTQGTNLGHLKIIKTPELTEAKVELVDYRSDKTTFTVRVVGSEETKEVQSVRVAVWSEGNGQDDLKWYTPTVSNNRASQSIDVANHANVSDKYNVHVYTTYTDGQTIGTNLGALPITVPARRQPTTSASQGRYDVINRIIYLDAGHGGSDPGAVYGVNEKDLNLSIQRQLKARLEAAGYQVVTTRTTDRYMDLLDRSRTANDSLSDLFVSIHFNASTNRSIEGIETYHYQSFPEYPARINAYHDNAARHERSAYLANAIHSAVVGQTQATNRGVHRKTFAVLRETVAPSVLLELGYMSNVVENAKLVQASYQSKLVDGIFQGIQSYYRRFS